MIHALKSISSNLKRCQKIFSKYKGQYIVYTNATKDGMVVASLLEIIRPTKNGIEFTMTNPYLGVSGEYSAFKYKGYMMPVDEFLYFIADQEDDHYEILSMMFYTSGLPQIELLKGLWSGIGVKDDQKYIASVPAIAVRRKKRIENWRDVLGTKLGYLKTTTLAEMVQKKLKTGIIKISR